MHCCYRLSLLPLLAALSVHAFHVIPSAQRPRSTTIHSAATKGFGSSDSSNSKSPVSSNMAAQLNWCPTLAKVSDLPQQDGTIGLIDTNLPTLKNGATNPTGAVSVGKLNGNTYCFGINCPQCKIPLIKAKLLMSSSATGKSSSSSSSSTAALPRVACTFCKSTYDLKTGGKVETPPEVSGGMFGGLVKSVFSAQDGGPLPVYKLGEKSGKVVIALD